jgi:hypothetical protein
MYWKGLHTFQHLEVIAGGSVRGLFDYPGGKTFYVNGGSDGPTTNAYNGKSPQEPKQTVKAALALCTTGKNDTIIVINYGGNARAVEDWPIVVSKEMIHIIGVGTKASKWATITATGAGLSAISWTGGRGEICGVELGGVSTGAGLEAGTLAGSWALFCHDCWFGIADGVGANGIKVPATFDAPYLRVEDCEFGAGLTAAAILLTGVSTRGSIGSVNHGNLFQKCVAAIDVDGSTQFTRFINNSIFLDADTAGDAIALPAGSANCYIDGNRAFMINASPTTKTPFTDAGSGNCWGINPIGILANEFPT